MVCIPDWLIPTLKGGLIRGDYLLQAAKLDRGFTAFTQNAWSYHPLISIKCCTEQFNVAHQQTATFLVLASSPFSKHAKIFSVIPS
jgi:hypothetical protein